MSKLSRVDVITRIAGLVILGMAALLSACGSPPEQPSAAPGGSGVVISIEQPQPATASTPPPDRSAQAATAGPPQAARSRWVAVDWAELPGWQDDPLDEAWPAWQRSCERAAVAVLPAALAALCEPLQRLSQASDAQRRAWMLERLQPYRVESLEQQSTGLLTGYYEPVLSASRLPNERHQVPLYRPPANLQERKPWYSRQEIDTLPEAQAALRGREIAWLADPLDALNLQIQGSGRLLVSEPDGSQRMVRLGYAGTNGQPYRSVGGWLLQQRATRDGSWPAIRQWAAQNPGRLQELLWSNPRVTFFQEQELPAAAQALGPRGAQGVPLTAGRSIAVDPGSIPYGSPVWLASNGPQLPLQRLVLAQDTGSAITGAVRADYFVGSGPEASQIAGRLRQNLSLWVLWPK